MRAQHGILDLACFSPQRAHRHAEKTTGGLVQQSTARNAAAGIEVGSVHHSYHGRPARALCETCQVASDTTIRLSDRQHGRDGRDTTALLSYINELVQIKQ